MSYLIFLIGLIVVCSPAFYHMTWPGGRKTTWAERGRLYTTSFIAIAWTLGSLF
ncbi:hypothetical protein LCGC14_0734580 [marine sediment metagenome]|uniref:Uncharacterized protein n=1 Tax=marine sediment metagenome TaxID=412755 RepID=A0A0F9STQ0_9ZZZZ